MSTAPSSASKPVSSKTSCLLVHPFAPLAVLTLGFGVAAIATPYAQSLSPTALSFRTSNTLIFWLGGSVVSTVLNVVKFKSPTVPRAQLLDVGRHNFAATNALEILLASAITPMLYHDEMTGWWKYTPVMILAVQTLVKHKLMVRAKELVEGKEPTGSKAWHAIYSVLELVKMGMLDYVAYQCGKAIA